MIDSNMKESEKRRVELTGKTSPRSPTLHWIPVLFGLILLQAANLHAQMIKNRSAYEAAEKDPTQYMHIEDAWQIALRNNPDLKAYRAEVEAAKARKEKADLLLPSNPEMELGYRGGTKNYSLLLDPTSAFPYRGTQQGMHGFEAGVSQELEIAGQRGLRRKMAGDSVDIAQMQYRFHEIQILGELRRNYFRRSAAEEMEEDLNEHVEQLRQLKLAMGPGFRDPRLGSYVLNAVQADLTFLETERNNSEVAFHEADLELKKILALDPAAELVTMELGSYKFREVPPLKELVRLAKENRPDLKAASLSVKRAQDMVAYQERIRYPNPTLFLYGGENVVGSGSLPLTYIGPESERERYMRGGVRFRLPLSDTNASGINNAKAELEMEKARLQKLQVEIELGLANSFEKYNDYVESVVQLQAALKGLHEKRNMFSGALLGGRISYYEFWGEHERWHSMVRQYQEVFLKALDALTELEERSGVILDESGNPPRSGGGSPGATGNASESAIKNKANSEASPAKAGAVEASTDTKGTSGDTGTGNGEAVKGGGAAKEEKTNAPGDMKQ